jgi:hypothetical protein
MIGEGLCDPSSAIARSRCIMSANGREDNYIESDEERESGHEDTRHYNFGCDNALGCNLGVDVAG